jgi:hypothetical protein
MPLPFSAERGMAPDGPSQRQLIITHHSAL